jgi:hypothetical protein
MNKTADLQVQAEDKRHMANLALRAGPGLPLKYDRALMRQHAEELEAEAAGLEAQAVALERST